LFSPAEKAFDAVYDGCQRQANFTDDSDFASLSLSITQPPNDNARIGKKQQGPDQQFMPLKPTCIHNAVANGFGQK
jgi:hypothetical protein